MEQSDECYYDWATDIIDLPDKINKIFWSKKDDMIYYEQCLVCRSLVENTAKNVQHFWIGTFKKETQSQFAWGLGEELVKLLNRAFHLLEECAEKKPEKSVSIILGGAGEFCEIVDDTRRHIEMMNRFIKSRLNSDADNVVLKKLQDKVDIDFSWMQDDLVAAYEKDIVNLRSKTDGLSKLVTTFIPLLETPPQAPHIAYNDLSASKRLGDGNSGNVRGAKFCGKLPVAMKEFEREHDFKVEYGHFMHLLATKSSHIVQILGHSEFRDKKIIVMERMYMDLQKLILEKKKSGPNNRPLLLHESVDTMLQIAKGMQSLHAHNLIHRDIKPANILVKNRSDGSSLLKLADFNVSKAKFCTENNNHTFAGTLKYMAPEILKYLRDDDHHNCRYTRQVDVFSFGRVCKQILEKFTGSQAEEIPEELEMIISDCQKDEADSRPSFKTICDRLWNVKESLLTKIEEIYPAMSNDLTQFIFPNYMDQQGGRRLENANFCFIAGNGHRLHTVKAVIID